MSDVQATMNARGSRYGDFTNVADTAQGLQEVMRETKGWERLNPVQRQALTAIADKIGRILSGDPNYADNWHDIQGYARLVEERLTPPVSQRDEKEFPLVEHWRDISKTAAVIAEILNNTPPEVQVVHFGGEQSKTAARMTWQDVAKLSAVHPVYIRESDGKAWGLVRPMSTPMGIKRGDVWFELIESIQP